MNGFGGGRMDNGRQAAHMRKMGLDPGVMGRMGRMGGMGGIGGGMGGTGGMGGMGVMPMARVVGVPVPVPRVGVVAALPMPRNKEEADAIANVYKARNNTNLKMMQAAHERNAATIKRVQEMIQSGAGGPPPRPPGDGSAPKAKKKG